MRRLPIPHSSASSTGAHCASVGTRSCTPGNSASEIGAKIATTAACTICFQRSAGRPLSAIPFREIHPGRWQRSDTSRLDAECRSESCPHGRRLLFGPGHLVDARRSGLLQTKEVCPQNIDGEEMQERRRSSCLSSLTTSRVRAYT